MKMTREIAWSIAWDRAQAQCTAAGRTEWNADDYELAALTLNTLWPDPTPKFQVRQFP